MSFSTTAVGSWLNAIISKIASFDIKPASPVTPELFARAETALKEYDYLEAGRLLQTILQNNPKNYDAILMLSSVYSKRSQHAEGCELIKKATKYYPRDAYIFQMLGNFYNYLGNFKKSAAAYKRALELNPQMYTAQHLLSAVQLKNPSIAPRGYVVNLFDSYAEDYEISLTSLDYKAHIELVKNLRTLPLDECLDQVLDLGCGTGFLGEELQKYFKIRNLVGVDLSSNMLKECKSRNIYTELHEKDIIEHLQQGSQKYDLITASDVMVYIGDLEPIVAHSLKVMQPNAYFSFTVESLNSGTFKLTPTGRYQHSLSYITSLSSKYGFSKIQTKSIDLRKEYGNIVPGYLVSLQK